MSTSIANGPAKASALSADPRTGRTVIRTRLSICARKQRFASGADAYAAAREATITLRPYRCDRCRQFHLTSRTKGKRVPRPRTE